MVIGQPSNTYFCLELLEKRTSSIPAKTPMFYICLLKMLKLILAGIYIRRQDLSLS